MNIAIDIRNLRDQYGGIPEYTRNAVRHLIRQGQKHHFTLFYNGVRDPFFDYPVGENVSTVTTRIPNKLFNPALHFIKTPKLDRLINKKTNRPIDLFFATDHNFFAFSRQSPKKILVVHDIGYHLFPYHVPLKGRIWIHRVAPFKLFKNFDHIIAVSNTTKKDLIRYAGVPEEKISVVYQGIDDSFFNKEYAEDVPLYNEPYIPLIGVSGARKNAVTFLQAFHGAVKVQPMFRDVKIVIVGNKKRNSDLEKIVVKYNLDNQVIWRDHVNDRERVNLYRHAALVVYPSLYEGFGLPPLEAMATGTPVIMAANSAMCEVSGSSALLIDPYRPETITEALICLLKNATVRARLIEKGRVLSSEFSWEKRAQELLSVFEKIAN